MPTFDSVLITGVAALLGALLTFLTTNRDSISKANSTAVEALSSTIEQLRKQINHLEQQLHELDSRFSAVMDENEKLVGELHRHRMELSRCQAVDRSSLLD